MNLLMTVLTNRDDIFHTLPVWLEKAEGPINYGLIIDDGGDPERHEKLHAEFGHLFTVIPTSADGRAQGFNAAMRTVMEVAHEYRPDFLVHIEEDFLPERIIDFGALARLCRDRRLLQVALLRQPWFHNEDVHGGVLEAREAQGAVFQRMNDGTRDWTEHRDHLTLNPCVLPGELLPRGWPEGAWSESTWSRKAFRDFPMSMAAYWGDRSEGPWVRHIGERQGWGY